jgi:shikimate dehydrogenase
MRYPTGKTHLYAILAHPVAHVRAAAFFNPAIEAEGRDAFLFPFHGLPDDLDAVVPMLARIGNLKGFVITIPHKERMAGLCAELGPDGALCGAVNTVRIEPGGRLVGDNFDGLGLIEGARADGFEPKGSHTLLIGAGGAGKAIAFAIARAGAGRLTIANRTPARAEELAAAVRSACPNIEVEVEVEASPPDPAGHDLLINATSLGLEPGGPMPLDPKRLSPGMRLIDIIAGRDTELMAAARKAGLEVMGGRPMVDHQIKAQLDFLGAPPLDDGSR